MNPIYMDEMKYASHLVKTSYHKSIDLLETVEIQEKGPRDLVTSLDYTIENYIITSIKQDFPYDKVIAEETHQNILTTERTWVIDPIDGTVNYARGFPFFGVQMALVVDKEPVASAIYLPAFNELYSACLDGGSFFDGKRIYSDSLRGIGQAIVTLGDFMSNNELNGENSREISHAKSLIESVFRVKMFGAACYDFILLARGMSDIHIMFDFGIWDIMPGLLLARESGVTFRTFNGDPLSNQAKTLIGSNNPELIDFTVSRFNT